MTANTGKGADGKRPTGADAKSGKSRKKTSAAKPPSDEVTVRTNDNGTAPSDDSDETVLDVPVADAVPPSPATEDDATVVDAVPPSPPPSASDEGFGGRTGAFALPKDPPSGDGAKPSSGPAGNDPAESTVRDEIGKFPRESGDSMPHSGRSAAMDAPQPPSGGYGSTSPGGRPALGPGGSSYAPRRMAARL